MDICSIDWRCLTCWGRVSEPLWVDCTAAVHELLHLGGRARGGGRGQCGGAGAGGGCD